MWSRVLKEREGGRRTEGSVIWGGGGRMDEGCGMSELIAEDGWCKTWRQTSRQAGSWPEAGRGRKGNCVVVAVEAVHRSDILSFCCVCG